MLPIKPVDAPLYVIAVITNPSRYRSRYHLYREFEKYIKDSGAILYTIEVAYGDRQYEVTDSTNPQHFQLRNTHELWHKENLINLAVSRLPADWKYVAWIDADVEFARKDWVYETLHQLQHYSFLQMFSHAMDLGPNHEPLQTYNGFVAQGIKNDYRMLKVVGQYGVWHPGYAWACRRDAWDHMGGLIDWAILGSADFYMVCALVGEMDKSLDPKFYKNCENYVAQCKEWERKAEIYIKRNLGYMDGLLLHYYHGSKKNRLYNSRSAILWENHFDPTKDIKRDWQGVWQLADNKTRLRDQMREYFRSRREDN
jgi:hypothetical protein